MPRTNFFPVSGPMDIQPLNANASQTIAVGDPVIFSSGRVSIATTTSTTILGVAMSSVTSSSADDEIRVNIHPDTVYEGTCSGTLAQTQVGVGCDIDGSTGSFTVDENSTTYAVLKIIDAPDGVGANAKVHFKFTKMDLGEQIGPVATGDISDSAVTTAKIADNAVTAAKIAAAAVGDGLDGGGGSAITVDVSDFAGTGLEDDGSENLRIAAAAAGDGLQGGAGSALAVDVSDFAGTGLEDDGSENIRIAAAAAGDGLQGGAGSALAVDVSDFAGTGLEDDGSENLRIAAAAAGDGLQGGAGSALAVDVSDFAGTGLEDDGSENLRLAAQGNGIAGGAGSTLSVNPDTTTGATVCGLTVGANGAGTTIDNDTLTHSSHTLQVGDGSLDQTQLANIASGGAGLTFVVWQHMTAATTTAIYNANFPVKARLIDCWTIQEGAVATNITVDDGTNPIVTAFAGGGADKAITRAAEIDDATFELAANDTLRVTSSGAQTFDLFCLFMRVA